MTMQEIVKWEIKEKYSCVLFLYDSRMMYMTFYDDSCDERYKSFLYKNHGRHKV